MQERGAQVPSRNSPLAPRRILPIIHISACGCAIYVEPLVGGAAQRSTKGAAYFPPHCQKSPKRPSGSASASFRK
ncbi:Uncharacterised protein [Mycobacteroides abscessus subsp. abscessus]|nr:Uncharacterised protein [Mycobacteroides abscessus subsp. abscessus]